MCGINGIFAYGSVAPSVERRELLATRDAMTRRGPDSKGLWLSAEGRVGLGQRRLAIIDLSPAGEQPMAAADGRFQVVFNGEIYNYRELRRDLEAAGSVFVSNSDTEVLLHLYRREQAGMLDCLRGMFALAIWDNVAKTLFLARDPYGIKPLYYADDGHTLRFASQVQALLQGGAIATEADAAGIVGFLLTGSVPEPQTCYASVRALPAGCYMIVRQDKNPGPVRYWDLPRTIEASIERAAAIPAGEELDYFRECLQETVNAHLVADVPVGAFLSAGLDSNTIVGLAAKITQQPLRTITLAFNEFEDHHLDEAPVAERMARLFGTQHYCRTLSMEEMAAELPKFLAAMDQPTIDGLNTWFVSETAAQGGLKVVLSGLGGDELLGGYATFRQIPDITARFGRLSRVPLLGELNRQLWSGLLSRYSRMDSRRAALLQWARHDHLAYWLERAVFLPWELDLVLDQDVAREGLARLREVFEPPYPDPSRLNPFARMVTLESTRYLRNQLLRDSDWTSMAHSLELRAPLVDRVFTEQVVGLACTGRLGPGKSVLPWCLSTDLPPELLQRPKTGFTVPLWKWLRKTDMITTWKRVKALHRPGLKDPCRWAYALLSLQPHMSTVLRQ